MDDHVLNVELLDFAAFIHATWFLWPPLLIVLIESPMNWTEIIRILVDFHLCVVSYDS